MGRSSGTRPGTSGPRPKKPDDEPRTFGAEFPPRQLCTRDAEEDVLERRERIGRHDHLDHPVGEPAIFECHLRPNLPPFGGDRRSRRRAWDRGLADTPGGRISHPSSHPFRGSPPTRPRPRFIASTSEFEARRVATEGRVHVGAEARRGLDRDRGRVDCAGGELHPGERRDAGAAGALRVRGGGHPRRDTRSRRRHRRLGAPAWLPRQRHGTRYTDDAALAPAPGAGHSLEAAPPSPERTTFGVLPDDVLARDR